MKVLISVDLEGITGSTSWESTNIGDVQYPAVARQMKAEALAAAQGAVEAGADEIYIKDAHDTGLNIDITGFPKQCSFIRSWATCPESMIAGLDETFDAVLYVGYHSPAGSNESPLSHTMNRGNNYVKFNQKICSEFLMHAYLAEEMGVPSVFISGDEGICSHAKSYFPEIAVCAVKKVIGNATISITPEEACERIRQGTKEGIINRSQCHIKLPETITMEICFKEHNKAKFAGYFPGMKQTGTYTVSYTGSTVREVAIARMFTL